MYNGVTVARIKREGISAFPYGLKTRIEGIFLGKSKKSWFLGIDRLAWEWFGGRFIVLWMHEGAQYGV